MGVAELVALIAYVSIFLVVLGLGLRSSPSDVLSFLRNHSLVLRSLLAMNVIMPLVAAAFAALFALHPAVKVALIALAVSPVPPFLPGRQLKLVAPGRQECIFGLLFSTSVMAIVLVPLTIGLLGAALGREVRLDPLSVARIVTLTVLLPLGAGMAARRRLPGIERLGSICDTVGMLLLALVLALLLARNWQAMLSLIGDGTLAAIIVVTVIGLAVGHLLGGPIEDDRTVLALSTASRHPAVAMAVASTANESLAPAAIFLAFVVGGAAAAPYAAWRKRLRTHAAASRAGAGMR